MTLLRVRWPAAIAAVVFGWANAADAQRAWETPGEREAADARRLAAEGRCDTALASFDVAIAKRPKDASLRRDRGRCHDSLNNAAPAIEDYRAYVAAEPNGGDAGRVRARLEQLEGEHVPDAKAPDHDGDGNVEVTRTPRDLENPFAEEAPTGPGAPPRRRPGFLVGPFVAGRGWSDLGFPKPTFTLGALGAFEYSPGLEVQARVGYLKTGGGGEIGDAAGVEATALHEFLFGLADRWDLGLGLGGGFEYQRTELKSTTVFLSGRAGGQARWRASEGLLLLGGPEVGLGILKRSGQLDRADTSDLALHYGAHVAVAWQIGGGKTPGTPPGTRPDPDAHPERDPGEPLEEDELWDD